MRKEKKYAGKTKVNAFNRWIQNFNRYLFDKKIMKLHLGCGERYLEGYTHIDLADFEHIDYKMPVDNLSIFENNSIDEIYASHVVEYFDRDEVNYY